MNPDRCTFMIVHFHRVGWTSIWTSTPFSETPTSVERSTLYLKYIQLHLQKHVSTCMLNLNFNPNTCFFNLNEYTISLSQKVCFLSASWKPNSRSTVITMIYVPPTASASREKFYLCWQHDARGWFEESCFVLLKLPLAKCTFNLYSICCHGSSGQT